MEKQVDKKSIFLKKRIILSQFFMAGLGALILFGGSYWEEKNFIGGLLFFAGAVLASIATVGRMWCSIYISGYKKDLLITTGPYSMCRNPLYFFSLLGAVGVGVATKTLSIPAVIFIAFAIYYPFVIRREERRLTGLHGEAFERYRKKTPGFVPSFSSYNEPEEYTIKPKFLRGRFIDSLWFAGMIGALGLIEALHRHGVIPTFFKLY
ncbi:MAG: isoprenylcysteine carboxylmethyltransferase family protein [Nitrospiraceae bacterium]|nr:MAG: isoprenylcysteine carboxylmethyltransferase family protein [Nitrospiraceae bacterium]